MSNMMLKKDHKEFNIDIIDGYFDHLLSYEYDNKRNLVIDTFNNEMELIDKGIYNELLNNWRKVDEEKLNYYANKFLSPKLNLGMNKIKEKYNEYLKENIDHCYTFVICPTYTCNMRCIYCYQQGNENLSKNIITKQNLYKIFEYIESEVKRIKESDHDSCIVIELFGGEAFQIENREIIEQIFDFARKNKYYLSATTNGYEIEKFYDLFLKYNKYIATIATTIDGDEKYHNSRRITKNRKGSFNEIVKNVDFLLDLGIKVELYTNFDRDNLGELEKIIALINKKQWDTRSNFWFKIGRVDDRLFETNYKSIISESELLEYIYVLSQKVKFPKNISLAFLKTCLFIAEKLNLSFNQNERGRQLFHYCWSTSPIQYVKYIDLNLNTFRCTYTVGRDELSLGTINLEDPKRNIFNKHGLLKLDECKKCKLGGYCSGGCCLSYNTNKDRQCEEEKKNFDYFIKSFIIPILKIKRYEDEFNKN